MHRKNGRLCEQKEQAKPRRVVAEHSWPPLPPPPYPHHRRFPRWDVEKGGKEGRVFTQSFAKTQSCACSTRQAFYIRSSQSCTYMVHTMHCTFPPHIHKKRGRRFNQMFVTVHFLDFFFLSLAPSSLNKLLGQCTSPFSQQRFIDIFWTSQLKHLTATLYSNSG